jgi:hypothetical protein
MSTTSYSENCQCIEGTHFQTFTQLQNIIDSSISLFLSVCFIQCVFLSNVICFWTADVDLSNVLAYKIYSNETTLIDRQGYFLSECIYYIYLLFTEITCTDMSLNLTEAITVMKISHSYNYLEMVTMSCQTGYIGTHVTSQCTDVNTWSQKPPICTSKILLSAIYTPNQ